jgi:hypothetical protein
VRLERHVVDGEALEPVVHRKVVSLRPIGNIKG